MKHEVRHTIQSKLLGPLYLTKVAIPSGLSYWLGGKEYHDNCWYEVLATRLGGANNVPQYLRYDTPWYWFNMLRFPIFR